MNEIVRQITLEGFAEAADLDHKAKALPRWRWLKRHNLRRKAELTRLAMAWFWHDHRREPCS
jgi:hypothetical protein